MLTKQKPYDFKKELLQVHKRNVRDIAQKCGENEIELSNGIYIVLPAEEDVVIETAAKDFQDYLFVSMGVSAMLSYSCPEGEQAIYLSVSKDLREANGYMGYSITIENESICLAGFDSCGVAQGLYFLEDIMNIRKAPFVKLEPVRRKALFDLHITQSPFGMFEYPDEALAIIAHQGYNAIELWMKDGCTTNRGDFLDMHLLSERAEKYGIRLFVQIYAQHSKHPDEWGAQEYYDKLYEDLFKYCPKIAGVTLIGEATQFSSRDPKVGKAPYSANFDENIPVAKPTPGWWPCKDYPEWIKMIKKSIEKVQPNAMLIFSTYNWGYAPEEDRVRLIQALPTDIALCISWGMFHKFKVGNSVLNICDYSLRYAECGEYFASEAAAAAKRGIRIHANSNTSGRTWDFGVIPYEPTPYQWIKRFEALIKAQKEWNVAALRENIHYGFQPSIIADLEKWAFFTPVKPLEQVLNDLIKRDFGNNAERAERAMRCFSEAITHYPTTNEDQYGAFRIGPSYPFWLENLNTHDRSGSGKRPAIRHAMFGNEIYTSHYIPDVSGRNSLPGTRIFDEIAEMKKMKELIGEGIGSLEESDIPNNNLLKLLNLAKFMYNTVITAIHAKEFYILKEKLNLAGTKENAENILNEIEMLLCDERKNAEDTIPIVQLDSRLGWEPSMEYTTDEEGLKWKIRQIDYELNHVLATYRQANNLI